MLLVFIVGIVIGIYLYKKILKPKEFWREKGVTHPKSWYFFGNMLDLLLRKKHISQLVIDIYKQFPKEKYVGFMQFTTPILLIRDLDLIKKIGIKDFDSFHDHQHFADDEYDPVLAKTLIRLRGDQWKQMRVTLSPVFTSSKIKHMFHLMVECSKSFITKFDGTAVHEVEMKDLFAKFATDIIASTAFGIRMNVTSQNDFYDMSQKLTGFSMKRAMKLFMLQSFPNLAKILKITMMDTDVTDYFGNIVHESIRDRIERGTMRPDLIHLLLEARKGQLKNEQQENKNEGFASVQETQFEKKINKIDLTDDYIVAQSLIFFFAGLETVSNALALMAYELAINPEVQRKLQQEIDEIYEDNMDVSYEALSSMKYLDQVVSETLRKWPPAFQTDRLCNKNFLIDEEKNFVVEKDLLVIIPVMAIHNDPEIFPNPERFDPDRFSEENHSQIPAGAYLPFGIGPRNCIGSRFALIELKTLFFYLLAKFDIVPTAKTEIPLVISPKKINLSPENGFPLGLQARNK